MGGELMDIREMKSIMDKRRRLAAEMEALERQQRELGMRVARLKFEREQCAAAVAPLNRRGPGTLWRSLTGRQEAALTEAQDKARRSVMAYEDAAEQLERMDAQLAELGRQLTGLPDVSAQLAQALSERRQQLMADDPEAAARIERKEREISYIREQLAIIGRALDLGTKIQKDAGIIRQTLLDAKENGAWSRGRYSQIKSAHGYYFLKSAGSKVDALPDQLKKYKAALTEISLGPDMMMDRSSYGKFVYYFYEGLDMPEKIQVKQPESIGQTERFQNVFNVSVSRLAKLQADVGELLVRETQALDEIIASY